jgi:hypothetical protein
MMIEAGDGVSSTELMAVGVNTHAHRLRVAVTFTGLNSITTQRTHARKNGRQIELVETKLIPHVVRYTTYTR